MKSVIGFILFFAAIFTVVMGISYGYDRAQCSSIDKNSSPGITTEWRGMIAGCYVTENGTTVPLDRWRSVSVQ